MTGTETGIRPFRVDVPQTDLDDLQARLDRPPAQRDPRGRVGLRRLLGRLPELAECGGGSTGGHSRAG